MGNTTTSGRHCYFLYILSSLPVALSPASIMSSSASYPMTRLGGKAFNHSSSGDAEAEYDRLRDLARQEAGKRSSCFDKAHQAYERGDGAAAHQLSEEGKAHAAKMDQFNKQASDYIFRENNAPGRVPADTIDLHGQFVEEAEDILEQRIRYAQQNGQTHLHVIVGKGNHSANHVQKIKPRVEQVCQSCWRTSGYASCGSAAWRRLSWTATTGWSSTRRISWSTEPWSTAASRPAAATW